MEQQLTRREMAEAALRASLLPAGAAFFAAWLKAGQNHQHAPEDDPLRNYQPKFFSEADFSALTAFTEILIPTDETPGAREARCSHFIDFVLRATPDTSAWQKAMQALKETGFYEANAEGRLKLMKEMSKPELVPEAMHPAYFAYRLIKQQTAFAFYTSRQGMIETLDYKGNSYNVSFPACNHPEHQKI